MPKQLEKTIVAACLKYLNSHPGCRAVKVHGTMNTGGWPDILACYNGRMIQIEVKTPERRSQVSKRQLYQLSKWSDAGAAALIVWDIDTLRFQLMSHFDAPRGSTPGDDKWPPLD